MLRHELDRQLAELAHDSVQAHVRDDAVQRGITKHSGIDGGPVDGYEKTVAAAAVGSPVIFELPSWLRSVMKALFRTGFVASRTVRG